MQFPCAALTGLLFFSSPTQGFGRFAASTLGFDAPRFQRFPIFRDISKVLGLKPGPTCSLFLL
jgi:hypothetical protein